ncbi:hypothetical protein GQE99_01445 [Maritimibacter sp. DP07]|uniref:SnoaL-like domain-containing protein n=1 Tax=Maritimibacter harenae TaxID=2606218 RepID=A0A845M017_9RHOB|nr:nuclear transport factor 2 family protein [Maritimibacter harenae]MZR11688.1 hypothetical protein [Maritimibacter harenae]
MDDQTLLNHAACEQVLHRFVDRLDARDVEGVISLTQPDMIWIAEARFEGHDAIRARLHGRPEALRTFHILSSIVIDFPESHVAVSRSHLTVYANDPDEGEQSAMQLRVGAIYHDRLTRRGGLWRISEKSIELVGNWP